MIYRFKKIIKGNSLKKYDAIYVKLLFKQDGMDLKLFSVFILRFESFHLLIMFFVFMEITYFFCFVLFFFNK